MNILRDVLSDEEVRLIQSFLRVRQRLIHAEGTGEALVREVDLKRVEELVLEFEGIGGLDARHELNHGV